MAGLNDDVDEGLDTSPEPSEINPEQPIPQEILFKMDISSGVEEEKPTPEDLFGVGLVKNEVPNLNAEFHLVEESINKLMDLETVYADIRSSNGVSKEDAEVVDALMPGFISDKKPIGFFTEDKSRTQLSETLNTINQAIDAQTADIVIKASDIAERSSKALSTCFTDIEARIISKLSSLHDQLAKIPLFLAKYPDENYHAQSFLRLLNRSIGSYEMEGDTSDKTKMDKYPDFVEAFKQACKFTEVPRNRENVDLLLLHSTSSEEEKDLLHYVNFGRISKITENNDIADMSKEENLAVIIPSFTYYHLLLSGTASGAKDYLMGLVNCAMKRVTYIGERKLLISSTDRTDTNNYQQKLSEIFSLHSLNSIDMINAVTLLSFVQDYCDYIEGIAKALASMLPEQELAV